MLIPPRNIQALACCAGACLQSSFCTLGKFQPAKWGIFNRRKLGNIQPALTRLSEQARIEFEPSGLRYDDAVVIGMPRVQ